MAKQFLFKQKNFFGGMSDDVRQESVNEFSNSSNYDIFSNPTSLQPIRSFEANETKSFEIENFLSTNNQLYGYGVVVGTTRVKIFEKVGDIVTSSWTDSTNSAGGITARTVEMFVHYKDYIYGANNLSQFWRWGDLTGAPTFDDSWKAVTYATVAQGIVGKDDILYMPHDNILASWDNTDFVKEALTLPSKYIIRSLEKWGNFLLIACEPKDTSERSVMYIWNYVDDDITNEIDLGEGQVKIIAQIEGRIVAVIDQYISSSVGARSGSLIIKEWSGGAVRTIKEFETNNTQAGAILARKVVKKNKLYFAVNLPSDRGTQLGLMVIGRKNSKYPLSVTLEVVDPDVGSGGIDGFFALGNLWFIAHSQDGSVNRTDDQDNYLNTSFVETQKIGDPHVDHSIISVSLSYTAIPSNGTVKLEYRVNEESSYTEIYTDDVDNSFSKEVTLEAKQGTNFKDFKEVQFKLSTIRKVSITGFAVRYVDKETNL